MGLRGPKAGNDKIILEQKKAALKAVVDFNDAHGIKFNRGDLYRHFGVNPRTAQIWLSTTSSLPWQVESSPAKAVSSRAKRDMPDGESTEHSHTQQARPLIQQSTVHNNGEDRKRLKSAMAD